MRWCMLKRCIMLVPALESKMHSAAVWAWLLWQHMQASRHLLQQPALVALHVCRPQRTYVIILISNAVRVLCLALTKMQPTVTHMINEVITDACILQGLACL